MSDLVAGDPASCSQAGGSLRRLATGLRAARVDLDPAALARDRDLPGRVRGPARRTQVALVDTTSSLADELDRVGGQLQEHAADLAEALQRARTIEDRAAAAGLRLVDGRVEPPWGVTGVADGAAQVREETRAQLQAALDTATVQLGRRRARLRALLEDSARRIEARSGAPRR